MKITEALCNVITEAGGTPTAEDAKSVTHALGTLYTTLGGTDTLPDDVADRINSLSDHIGGGGEATISLARVIVRNTTGASGTIFGCDTVKITDGAYAVVSASRTMNANSEIEITVPCNGGYVGSENWLSSAVHSGRLSLKKTEIADPSKVVATLSRGSGGVVRNPSRDNSAMYGYLFDVNCGTSTDPVIITISESA